MDTLPAIVRGLGDTYEHFNGSRPTDEQIQATVGLPLTTQMHMFRSEPVDEEEMERRIKFAIHRFEDYAHLEREYGPAVEVLELVMSAGIKAALVTSKSALEVSLLSERVRWVHNVDTVICASDVEISEAQSRERLSCLRTPWRPAARSDLHR